MFVTLLALIAVCFADEKDGDQQVPEDVQKESKRGQASEAVWVRSLSKMRSLLCNYLFHHITLFQPAQKRFLCMFFCLCTVCMQISQPNIKPNLIYSPSSNYSV